MSVYLMWAEGTNFFKIGYSKNIRSRLSDLQVACPHSLRIAASLETDDPEGVEEQLHIKWGECQVRGEWFDIPIDKWPNLLEDYKSFSPLVKYLHNQSMEIGKNLERVHLRVGEYVQKSEKNFLVRDFYLEDLRRTYEKTTDELTDAVKQGFLKYEELQSITDQLQLIVKNLLSASTKAGQDISEETLNSVREVAVNFEKHNCRFNSSDLVDDELLAALRTRQARLGIKWSSSDTFK